ncbi:hypothetical protein LY76DRAFT_101494 [Colletotrichum caudatum]|nr:hypothetical protein LY76DRAFT_101494 [Colletotrichum caudatum]
MKIHYSITLISPVPERKTSRTRTCIGNERPPEQLRPRPDNGSQGTGGVTRGPSATQHRGGVSQARIRTLCPSCAGRAGVRIRPQSSTAGLDMPSLETHHHHRGLAEGGFFFKKKKNQKKKKPLRQRGDHYIPHMQRRRIPHLSRCFYSQWQKKKRDSQIENSRPERQETQTSWPWPRAGL